MRVISGRYKGRQIHSVKGAWLRPTSDRNREFIFSYLGNWMEGAVVLDLFAGTGALGIEAMSRGAAAVTFVDFMPAAVQIMERNLQELEIAGHVFRREAISFIKWAAKRSCRYDIIFCDPPYRYQETEQLLTAVVSGALLRPGGLFVYETGSREPLPAAAGWNIHKDKHLGDTRVLFYERKDGEQDRDLSGIL